MVPSRPFHACPFLPYLHLPASARPSGLGRTHSNIQLHAFDLISDGIQDLPCLSVACFPPLTQFLEGFLGMVGPPHPKRCSVAGPWSCDWQRKPSPCLVVHFWLTCLHSFSKGLWAGVVPASTVSDVQLQALAMVISGGRPAPPWFPFPAYLLLHIFSKGFWVGYRFQHPQQCSAAVI